MPHVDALCPACASVLAPVEPGIATCPEGHGRAVTRERARTLLPREAQAFVDHVVRKAPMTHAPCPVCRGPMARGEVPLGTRRILLWSRPIRAAVDACPEDQVLWLDAAAAAALR